MQSPLTAVERALRADLASGRPSTTQMLQVLSQGLRSLYPYAYRLLRNKADAEDAVQDALLAALKHLHQFRGEARFSTWLTTIVVNSVRMQLRKRLRHTHVSLDSPPGQEHKYPLSDILVDRRPSPEYECHHSRLNAQLMKSAAQLSPTLGRTFHLRFVDHLSIDETARVLGVPSGTVKARTARARAKLQRALRGLHSGPRFRGRLR